MWPVAYSISSINRSKMRSIGIIIILGLGISLIPSVMNWTSTGILIEVQDYIDDSMYQLGVRGTDVNTEIGRIRFERAIDYINESPIFSSIEQLTDTVCIVDGHTMNQTTYFLNQDLFYAQGVKDARLILADNEILSKWSQVFTYTGNMSLQHDEAIVSERFIDYLEIATGRHVTIGDTLNIDIVLDARGEYPFMTGESRYTLYSLTIVGVYRARFVSGVLGNSFLTMHRHLIDPFDETLYPVLDLADSMIVSPDAIPLEIYERIQSNSFFKPVALGTVSASSLLEDGETNVENTLLGLIDILNEHGGIETWGVEEAADLQFAINTYIQSRVLVIMSLPTLLVSVIIIVNISESSVSRRKREMYLLRVKGASYNHVLTSYLYEAMILGASSLVIGLLISTILASIMGSCVEPFHINLLLYQRFITNTKINPIGIIVATVIALCLPMSFMVHIARLVGARELDDEEFQNNEESSEDSLTVSVMTLGILIIAILSIPLLAFSSSFFCTFLILVCTLLIYFTAVLGARIVRKIVGKAAKGSAFLIGEKTLYVARSLLKRKGRFMPLIIILTLISVTSASFLVESTILEHNISRDFRYSIGADLRIEPYNATNDMQPRIQNYKGVYESTSVYQISCQLGETNSFLIGIDAIRYSHIGYFEESDSNALQTRFLQDLSNTSNGIILSDILSTRLNKTIGDNITIAMYQNGPMSLTMEIVATVRSAPGLGETFPSSSQGLTITEGMGFQIVNGYAIVNSDYLLNRTLSLQPKFFLASTTAGADIISLTESMKSEFGGTTYSPLLSDAKDVSRASYLFLSGYNGLSYTSYLILILLGLFSIISLLGTTVRERISEYAILRSIGATKRQIILLSFEEFATIVITCILSGVLIGIPLGLTLGQLSYFISPIHPLLSQVLLLPFYELVTLLLLQQIILIPTCILPARHAASINPAEQLRNL